MLASDAHLPLGSERTNALNNPCLLPDGIPRQRTSSAAIRFRYASDLCAFRLIVETVRRLAQFKSAAILSNSALKEFERFSSPPGRRIHKSAVSLLQLSTAFVKQKE
jgi:hypothetical protein